MNTEIPLHQNPNNLHQAIWTNSWLKRDQTRLYPLRTRIHGLQGYTLLMIVTRNLYKLVRGRTGQSA